MIAIRSRITGNILYQADAGSLREAVEQAIAAQVSLAGADLRNGDFRKGKFGGVDFRGADLRNADFTGAVLTGARMAHADCTGAKFVGAFLEAADLANAILVRANMTGAKLARSNMDGVVADDLVLKGADVSDAKADVAILSMAQFAATAISEKPERVRADFYDPNGPVRINAVQAMYDACERLKAAYDRIPANGGWMPSRIADALQATRDALDTLRASARQPLRPGEPTVPPAVAEGLFNACRTLDEACRTRGAQGAAWKDLDRAHETAERAMQTFEQWSRGPAPLPEPMSASTRARGV